MLKKTCEHKYNWKYSSGYDYQKYYDDYLIGKCQKCGHEIERDL